MQRRMECWCSLQALFNEENGFDGPLRFWEIHDPYIIKANKDSGHSTAITEKERRTFFLKVKVFPCM